MKRLSIFFFFIILSTLLFKCSNNDSENIPDIDKDNIVDIQLIDIVSPDVQRDVLIDISNDTFMGEDVYEIFDIDIDINLDIFEKSDALGDNLFDVSQDSGFSDADIVDIQDVITDIHCKETSQFDYKCDPKIPESCPKGICILNQCIAPELDPDRWSECSDGLCSICEDEEKCPSDCREPYKFNNTKSYDGEKTITVWVHGFYNKKPEDIKKMVYGNDRGCSGIEEKLQFYGIDRPCSDTQVGKNSPIQLTSVEYYGAIPASYLTQQDIDEIESYPYDSEKALHRYALIVAKFIKYKLNQTGATHINLACHSMGCLISRYLIENNLENLATDNRIVRWFTSAGVIAGARLAKLYDNPTVQQTATLIGLELSDFVVMHPDFVMDYAARWDHKLYEGNSPLFSGIYINHYAATDPKIKEAMNIALLDLNNPQDEPNDGIMYTLDEYFHSQKDSGAFFTRENEKLIATHSYNYVDHMTLPETEGAGILATAALFHKRNISIKLRNVYLKNDRENHTPFDGEHGSPPAEISYQIEIRYNPYIKNRFGVDTIVHIASVEHRSADLFTMKQDEEKDINLTLFEGPVMDDMDKLSMKLKLLEVDYYPRFNIKEWSFDIHQELISFEGLINLENYSLDIENQYIKVTIQVNLKTIY